MDKADRIKVVGLAQETHDVDDDDNGSLTKGAYIPLLLSCCCVFIHSCCAAEPSMMGA